MRRHEKRWLKNVKFREITLSLNKRMVYLPRRMSNSYEYFCLYDKAKRTECISKKKGLNFMGVRFRKSINLGGGFRVNISKSGIGYSWGVKGVRLTKTARGTKRSTLSIPGTGISYVSEEGKKRNSQAQGHSASGQSAQTLLTNETSTEVVNVKNFQPVEYKELIDNITKVRRYNLLSTILICTFLLSAVPFFIITGIAGIILKIFIHCKLSIPMEYEFDEESKLEYDNLCATWMSLNKNKKFWQTISESHIDKKTSGGASRGVKRISAKAINKMPWFISSNVSPFGLKLKRKKLLFLPDKLLIVTAGKVGAISYEDIYMGLGISRFVETDPVPKDAKILEYTWEKVNRDGSPDKRYKGNRKIPVCEYGRVTISSGSSLQVEIMCSNSSTIQDMKQYSQNIFK